MRHLDAALTLLRLHPEIAPAYEGRYRRMLIRDLPFGIFYSAQPNRIDRIAKESPNCQIPVSSEPLRPPSGTPPK